MDLIEGYYQQSEPQRLESMSEQERQAFWDEVYQKELTSLKERRSELSNLETEIKGELTRTASEIDLMVPDEIRELVEELATLSQQTYYGSRYEAEKKRAFSRSAFVNAVRLDLRVEKTATRSTEV